MRWFVLLALLAGCNVGGVDPGGGSLVGFWSVSFAGRTLSYSFNADGTLSFSPDASTTATGTYSISGQLLTVDASVMGMNPARVTQPFYLAGDRLALPAFVADGEVQGIVGRWTSSSKVEQLDGNRQVTRTAQSQTTYEFLADGTLNSSGVLDGMPVTAQGTWIKSGSDSYAIKLSVLDTTAEIVDGKALGAPVLRRVTR